MVKIILASHGDLAKDILQSGEMTFGTQPNVRAVTPQPSEGPDGTRTKMEGAVTTFENPEQVLFMVDLWGDTPSNQTSGLTNGHEDTWAVVTGLNLPMLIEAFTSRMSMEPAQEIAAHVYGVAREGVRLLPEVLEPTQEKQVAESVTLQGAIPEGAVIGDRHIKYVLARIDSCLLHGQATAAQTKAVKPTYIIMVFGGVAKGELRKNLIEQAAPPGVKTSVVPVDKTAQVIKDPRSGNTKVMLLFETPQDAPRVIEGGVDVEKLDIGSMAHSIGKVVVSKVLSLGRGDVETSEELKAKGIQFDVRKVSNDSKENMDDIVKKAKVKLT